MPDPKQSAFANGLLAGLPRMVGQRLAAGVEPVTLTFGEVLCEPGEPMRHVYFPHKSVVSLLTPVNGRVALKSAWSALKAW